MEEFKPNSNKSKEEDIFENRKRLEPVVKNPIKTKSAFGRFIECFLVRDLPKLKDYLVHDLLIPTAKNVVQSGISTAVDVFLYGGRGGSDRNRYPGGYISYRDDVPAGRYAYGSYYNRQQPYSNELDRRYYRSTYNWDEIPYDTKDSANDVLNGLKQAYATYKRATVLDLFDLAGRTGERSDDYYGWPGLDILDQGYVYPKNGRWFIWLPKPMALKPQADRD